MALTASAPASAAAAGQGGDVGHVGRQLGQQGPVGQVRRGPRPRRRPPCPGRCRNRGRPRPRWGSSDSIPRRASARKSAAAVVQAPRPSRRTPSGRVAARLTTVGTPRRSSSGRTSARKAVEAHVLQADAVDGARAAVSTRRGMGLPGRGLRGDRLGHHRPEALVGRGEVRAPECRGRSGRRRSSRRRSRSGREMARAQLEGRAGIGLPPGGQGSRPTPLRRRSAGYRSRQGPGCRRSRIPDDVRGREHRALLAAGGVAPARVAAGSVHRHHTALADAVAAAHVLLEGEPATPAPSRGQRRGRPQQGHRAAGQDHASDRGHPAPAASGASP